VCDAVASAYPEGGEQGAGRGHKKQEVTSRFVFSDKLVLQARFVLRELPDLDRWFPAKRGASCLDRSIVKWRLQCTRVEGLLDGLSKYPTLSAIVIGV
jgi:hypothetical protein